MAESALPQGIVSALQSGSACDFHVFSTALKARRVENHWNDEAERQLQNAHGRACQMCQVHIVSQDSQWTEVEKRELCLNLMRVVSDSEILSNRSVMSAATALLSISEDLEKGQRKEEWMLELYRGLEQLVHNPGLIQPARRKVSSAFNSMRFLLKKSEVKHGPAIMNKKPSHMGNVAPCSGRWRRAKQRAETFEFRDNHTALFHLAKHCFVDQNEFRLIAFKKGATINSTSDHLTLKSLLQLKSVIEDLAEEEAEYEARTTAQGNEPSNRRAGESDREHRGESAQQKGRYYDKVNRQQPNPYHRDHSQDFPREEENYSRDNFRPARGRKANRSYSFSSYDEPRHEKRQRHSRDNEPQHGEHKQEHYYRKEVDGGVSTDFVPEESNITTLPPVEPKEATNKHKTFVRVLDVDCGDLRDKVLCACDRIGSYKFVGWCQSRHLLDVIFENNREAAAALIDIEALGLYSTKRSSNMPCKVFLKNSDFEGGPYTGGVKAPSRNITGNGSQERRSPYPSKQPDQWNQYSDRQNRSPENAGMNWGGSNSKQQHIQNGGGHRRFGPSRSRSRSPGWSRSRSPAGRRRDYGGSRRDFPRGSRPYHDAGRDVHYEGGGGQRPDVRPDSRRSFDRFNEMSPPSPQYMSRSKHSRSNSPGRKPRSGYSAGGSTVRERRNESYYHRGGSPHHHRGGSPPHGYSSRGRGVHPWQGGGRWEERTRRSSNPLEWRRRGGGPWRGGRGGGDRGFGGGKWRGGRGRGGSRGNVDYFNAEKTSGYDNQLEAEFAGQQQNEEENSAQLESGGVEQDQPPENLGWGLQYVDSSIEREGGDIENQNAIDTPDSEMVMKHDDTTVEEEGGGDELLL